MTLTLDFFKFAETAWLPERATPGAAGYDLCSSIRYTVYPGERVLVPTGIGVQIPPGWAGLIRDRSSMALRGVTTRAGVIDSDYRGEIKVLLTNESDEPYSWAAGERVAQLVVVPCCTDQPLMIDRPDATERGEGGFGSTGK